MHACRSTLEDPTAEAEALRKLHAAGVRVPQVYAHYEGVLVMELIVDELGRPAPQLAQLRLPEAEALKTYEHLVGQVVLMLLADLVHGDFSPYNVLVGVQGPVVIDLPQVVSASHNQKANVLVERDIQSVARYLGMFSRQVQLLGREAWQVWHEYERGALVAEFRPTVPVMAADAIELKPAPANPTEVLDLVREARREQEQPWRRGRGDRPHRDDRGPQHGGDRPPPRPQHAQQHHGDRGPRQQHHHQGPQGQGQHQDRGQHHGAGDRGPRPQHHGGGDRGPRPNHPSFGGGGDRGPRPQHGHSQNQPRPQGHDGGGGGGGGGRRRRRRRRGSRPDGPPAGA